MKLIVGLGNPGSRYSGTRHNIGFNCIGHFARRYGIKWDRKLANARTGRGFACGEDLVLARPQTYMNLSGSSVARLLHRFKLKPQELILIHDDLDLTFGRIRMRQGGGSGGHNGVSSIIDNLGGERDFIRLRFGIGRPASANEDDIVDYVLSPFPPDERTQLHDLVERAVDALCCLLEEGLEAAMNRFN
jgi:PTH1 family peptidyl-tRNA hydrolase